MSSRPLWWCQNCKDFSVYCSLCQLPLRGSAFICVGCGHGGHVSCVKNWFKSSVECATGCSCRCAELALSMTYRHRMTAVKSNVFDRNDESEEDEDENTSDSSSSQSKSVESEESSASDSYSDSYSDSGSDSGSDVVTAAATAARALTT